MIAETSIHMAYREVLGFRRIFSTVEFSNLRNWNKRIGLAALLQGPSLSPMSKLHEFEGENLSTIFCGEPKARYRPVGTYVISGGNHCNLAFFVFSLTILILFLLTPTSFATTSRAKREVKKGNLLYNEGKFEEALKKYEEASLDSPDCDIVNFNLGAALYKTDDFRKAIGHFEKSLVSEDQSLEQKTSYNLGNAEYKYGISKEDEDLQGAINLLKRSLGHYEHAIQLDPEDEDAKYNYEFVKKELERLQEKLKQKKQEPQEQRKTEKEEKKEEQEPQRGASQQEKEPEGEEGEEERKPQEQEEAPEEEKKPEEKESETEKKDREQEEDRERQRQVPQPVPSTGEMSEKEALMLLDSYRGEEEPKGLYKEKVPIAGLPEVLKDW